MNLSQPTKDLIGNITILLLIAAVVVWGLRIVHKAQDPKEEVDDTWPDAM